MAPKPQYAKLPPYQYHKFAPQSFVFSEHPVIPPSPPKMRYFGEGDDADDPPKNVEAPNDPPADTETSEPILDIIDPPPSTFGDGKSTVDLRR
jgi:hypothetical protein